MVWQRVEKKAFLKSKISKMKNNLIDIIWYDQEIDFQLCLTFGNIIQQKKQENENTIANRIC